MRKFYSSGILFLAIFSGYCLQAQNLSTDKVVLDLVKKNAVQLKLSTTDVDNVAISDSYTDAKTNIRYVYLQQTYQGLKVYNSIKTVVLRNNELLFSSGNFVENIQEKAGAGFASAAIEAEQAIAKAALHLKLPAPAGLRSIENKFNAEKKMIFSAGGISKKNIETELMWVAADDGSSVKSCMECEY